MAFGGYAVWGGVREAAVRMRKPTLIHFTMFRGRLPVALVLLLLNLVALADTPRLRLLFGSTPSAKK